ncbi:membrane peptidoglycan carboxypeptidase [Nocardioides thalensis]|uniref:Membrane peptidoglycan carboxypeptidase n=1 Tax=Nocardioides thalensis TaxID=1914755 RepID=A0A853C8P1_9ACTN|nr:membrane peptidoglycan carboxypeptidase [Nocardioides thalensis]
MAGKRAAASRSKTAKSPKTPKTAKQRILWFLKWGLIGGLVMLLIAAAGFFVAYRMIDIPDPNDEFLTETTHVYFADGKTDLGSFAIQERDAIDYDEMPESIKDAVVAAENQSFWTDEGIDPKGILSAAFNNASGGTTRGASTITQQYVKILYLTQERTWKRKLKEAILSLKIQNQYSKEQVLEGYLNTIYFGRGAYGIQAAAQAYFGIDAKDLDLKQSAVLAAILNDPNDLDPDNGRAAKRDLKGRYQYVIDSMVEMEEIDSSRGEKARNKLPKVEEEAREDSYGGQKGHMLQMVRQELLRLGYTEEEIDGGGLEVTTTFTEQAMTAAEDGVLAARPDGFSDKELHVGVASVEPGTGAVRGFYAGQDYLQSQLNWAIEGGQAGSTFKAFAVAAALKEGWSLKDTFDGNSPYIAPDGNDFENQGDQDYGSAVSLLAATEDSVNTAFVDMTLETPNGPERIIETANEMGIPPEKPGSDKYGFPTDTRGLQANAQVALGSQTVSPINMANGYATLAANGVMAEPYIIEKVVEPNGETWTHKVDSERVLSEDIAADASYALQQVVEVGTGTGAQAIGRPAAGKTGTATNDDGEVVSAWFAGYTPQLSTAVTYVRGDGADQIDGWLPEFFGSAFPLDTWVAVMNGAMEGLPIEDFPEPAWVDGEAPAEGHAPYTPPPPPPKTKKPDPEPKDSDGDGVPDDRDKCPDNPDIPGSPDPDGNCEVGDQSGPQDSDGDGTPDDSDPCPQDPQDACTEEPDSDGDDIPNSDDPCPNDPLNLCDDGDGGGGGDDPDNPDNPGGGGGGGGDGRPATAAQRTTTRRRRRPVQPDVS